MEFGLHHVAYPGPTPRTLDAALRAQLGGANPANRTLMVAGYANHNGVIRFKDLLRALNRSPGTVQCFFAGSRTSRMCSRQAVEALLATGCHVHLLDKARIFLHAKMFLSDGSEPAAIVTSGNLTPSGVFRNLEFVLLLTSQDTQALGIDAAGMEKALRRLSFASLTPSSPTSDLAWGLTYDETTPPPGGWSVPDVAPDEPTIKIPDPTTLIASEVVLGVTLSPHEAGRIRVNPTSGTPYVYLSKEYLGYLPALQTPFPENPRSPDPQNTGHKSTVSVEFLDASRTVDQSISLYDTGNQDLRLLVGPLQGTGLASAGDIVLLKRVGYSAYRLRVVRRENPLYNQILPFLQHSVGGAGKLLGFIPATSVANVI
jgi:hypothetical protein